MPTRRPFVAPLLAVAVILGLAVPALAKDPVGWGGDVNAGSGPKLVAEARPGLLAIVEASEAERAGLIEAFAKEPDAYRLIEAVKRFRNPELRPLFHALLEHENWKVRHRALYALEGYRDGSVVPRAWEIATTAEEPRLREKALVNAIYMHGADVVYVKGGEKVRAGQLLGSMGMGYSIENGGHFAHLHYGLYPGGYSDTHNYGYRSVKAGLADWTDPARLLPLWIERTQPLVPELDGVSEDAAEVLEDARDGRLSAAWKAAQRLDGEDGERVRESLSAVAAEVERRARAELDRGYARRALTLLEDTLRSAKGLPGVDGLSALADEWQDSDAFDAAVEADRAFTKLEAKELKLLRGKDGREKAREAWNELLEEYGDTSIRPRIERKLDLLGE